ncbi:hypothetical protein IPM44_02665 [bacterium]|jgi:hypothetical protein|nr:MAG: hypothetical protein IPM44_02665 [bacterium]
MSKRLDLEQVDQDSVIHIGVRPSIATKVVRRGSLLVSKLRVVACGDQPNVEILVVDNQPVIGPSVWLLGHSLEVNCLDYTPGWLEVGYHTVISKSSRLSSGGMTLSPFGGIIADLWVSRRG